MLYLDSQYDSIQVNHDRSGHGSTGTANEGEDEAETSEEMESEGHIAEQTGSLQQNSDSNGSSNTLNRAGVMTLGSLTNDSTNASAASVTNSTGEFASALSHFKEPSVLRPRDMNVNRQPSLENELMTDDERDSNLSY
jgi:hypothetical protein